MKDCGKAHQDGSVYPKRRRHRMPNLLNIMAVLVTLNPIANATDVCGASQDWFHGWIDSAEVTYQAMAVSYTHDTFVVGGTTTNLEAYDDLYWINDNVFDSTDDAAAIIIMYYLNAKDPDRTYAVSRVDFGIY